MLGREVHHATLGIIGSKAGSAASISAKIAAGEPQQKALADAIANEWGALTAIMLLSLANVVIGVWRPRLRKKAD